MNVLILTGKELAIGKELTEAFIAKGASKVEHKLISEINLVSRNGRTSISNGGLRIEEYDAVFLRANLKLTPFIEPLLDELKALNIFTQFKPGAFYFNSNEALQVATLNGRGISMAKSMVVADAKLIRDSNGFHYPLIFKSYVGQIKTQSILIETPRSLASIVKSIKMDLDAVILREFEEADLIQCAVIGERVFAIRRRWNGVEIEKLSKGLPHRVSESECSTAIRAALACNCEIATVKISKGRVTEVVPDINFEIFNHKTGEDLFGFVAEHFYNRVSGIKVKRPKPRPSIFDQILNRVGGLFRG